MKTFNSPKKSKIPPAPRGLNDAGKSLWRAVVEQFVLEPHHQKVLGLACRQADIAAQAEVELRGAKLTSVDRFGQNKANPLIEVGKQASLAVARLLRELGLDSVVAETTPRLYSRRGTGA